MDKFLDDQLFINPPNEYKVYPILHNLCDDNNESVTTGFDLVKKTGAGGVVTNITWTKEWVTDKNNIKRMFDVLSELEKQNYKTWLYDEYYYPSGWANGYATKDHPEFIAKNLDFKYKKGKGNEKVSFNEIEECQKIVKAAFYKLIDDKYDYENPIFIDKFTNNSIDCVGISGEWVFICFYIRKHNVSHVPNVDPDKLPGGNRGYLDFLNKEAVKRYFDVSLKPIADYSDDKLSKVQSIFTDEPALMSFYFINEQNKMSFNSVAWTDNILQEFQKNNGFDLSLYLPFLFWGDSLKAKEVRMLYYRLIANMMYSNFTNNMSKLCNANKTKYSGHLLLEESLVFHVGYYGDFMKTISGFDYPGFDILVADNQKFWEKGDAWGSSWFLAGKFASSASRIKGHNITMVEICPYINAQNFYKNPYENFMKLTTSIIFTGATHVNSYGYQALEAEGRGKEFNDYIGRILYILKNSSSAAEVGIYYPILDTQANFTCTELTLEEISPTVVDLNKIIEDLSYDIFKSKLDFNFVTEYTILDSTIINQTISIGQINCKYLIIPSMDFISLKAIQKIKDFIDIGGVVYFINKYPSCGACREEHDEVKELIETIKKKSVLININDNNQRDNMLMSIKEKTNNIKIINDKDNIILMSKYVKKENEIYFIINSSDEIANISIELKNQKVTKLYNPETSEISIVNSSTDINLNAGRGIFVIINN